MDARYEAWIEAHVEGDGYGQCKEVTARMADAFPELARVRGHYLCLRWGVREHWWLTTPNGTVVDPTVAQFPSPPTPEAYQPLDEDEEEPTGKCPNCGGYCYEGRSVCSDSCEASYIAYLMGEAGL